jgi:hypothetical protein
LRALFEEAKGYEDWELMAEPFYMAAESLDVSLGPTPGEDEGPEDPSTDADDLLLGLDVNEDLGPVPAEAGDMPDADYYEEVNAKPPQLPPHDMDIPEEPILVRVIIDVWNKETRSYEKKDLGEQKLIPTGCERPEYLEPHCNKVRLKSALPRDKQMEANLHAAWQKDGLVSRRWRQERLEEEGLDIERIEREIADDIPLMLALQGKPDPSGVGQTEGNSNNGAPLPPGPGPGRGNLNVPGDNRGGPQPAGGQ